MFRSPGRGGDLVDTRAWITSGRLWKQVIGGLLRQMIGLDRLQYSISTLRYSDVTFKPRKSDRKGRYRGPQIQERRRFWSAGSDELFCITEKSVLWNEFFTDWVIRPFETRLRKTSERIDDVLRVLDPNIQPNYARLEDVWRTVFEAEDGVNSLPSSFEVALRENEELPTSTRLVTLWRALRRLATREAVPSFDLSADLRLEPKAQRRRRGG